MEKECNLCWCETEYLKTKDGLFLPVRTTYVFKSSKELEAFLDRRTQNK